MKTLATALVITAHAILIVLAYSSPFWLDWRLVILGVGMYYLQLLVFGWCVLSLRQFQGRKQTFHEWYLTKFGIRVNREKLHFILNRVIPGLLVFLAVVLQVIIRVRPLVRL